MDLILTRRMLRGQLTPVINDGSRQRVLPRKRVTVKRFAGPSALKPPPPLPFLSEIDQLSKKTRGNNRSDARNAERLSSRCGGVARRWAISERAGIAGIRGARKLRKLLFGSRSGPHNERPSRSATVTNRKLFRCLLPLFRAAKGPQGSSANLVENLPPRSSTPFDPRAPDPRLHEEAARARRTAARVKLYLRASGSLKVHFIKDPRDYSRNRGSSVGLP